MRQSHLFTKTQKEPPQDEESKNAKFLTRAGFVHKEMAGAYSFLPLGWIVMEKIMQIIREEMNAIGGQEVFLTSLQDPDPWKASGRWNDDIIDVWFKTKLKNESEIGLANTHEEALTQLMKNHIQSYRDLPKYVYQFQTKFRNELRAKSGIMRTREFIMKDLYSFSRSPEEHEEFYEQAKQAYEKIFRRVGLGDVTFLTSASGGSFSRFSHEFQTLCEAGEDTIYIDRDKGIAINEDIVEEEGDSHGALRLEKAKAVEVGNIFSLGTKYAEALGLMFRNEQGTQLPVFMGSYGIGPARTMGVIAEVFADERGLVWPISVAPFAAHVIELAGQEKEAEFVYDRLVAQGIEVLYDDRKDMAAGEKFADADLIGIPFRIVVSEKTTKVKSIELKRRDEEQAKLVQTNALSASLFT